MPAIGERAAEELPAALAHVDRMIGDSPFVCGDHPTIADCTLFAALEFARMGEVRIDPELGCLRRWYDDFCRRPSAGFSLDGPRRG